jgi:hypothetical protein
VAGSTGKPCTGAALFCSALQNVHSPLADEPTLVKDERHPRKRSAPQGAQHGGRGLNQLGAAEQRLAQLLTGLADREAYGRHH